MKLILRRSQRATGLISKSVQFSLNARVQLTEAEAANVKKYKMGSEVLYSKDRMGYRDWDNESAGGMARNLAAIAVAVTITVNDLVRGKTVECKDILEMSAIVEQIKSASGGFKIMLDAAAQFEGEQVLEY